MMDIISASERTGGGDNGDEKERESTQKLLKRQLSQKGGILRRRKFNI